MFSLDTDYLQTQLIPLTQMSHTLRKLGQYQGKQELLQLQRPALIKTLKEVAIIQSSESSNRMEGITIDPTRLEKILSQKIDPKNRSEAQVLGYRKVLSEIHNHYQKISITPKTILKMHEDMLKFTDLNGGTWKTKDNMIEERLPDGRWITRFMPVSAAETPFYMQTLCDRFARLWRDNSIDRLVLVFAFVFDFLCIHPFADGNGRISRLLTVLLLHKINIDITRYISYERLVEETKESYYDILQEASVDWHQGKHRLIHWFEYNFALLIAGYKELEKRVTTLDAEKGSKTAWALEMIDDFGTEFSMGDLVKACPGISRPMLRHILETLRKEKKLISSGAGRNAKWCKITK